MPEQQPYAPQPMPPAPPAPKKNGLGTASLVLGIIAAVFAFIPLFGAFVAIPLAALAIIFGGVGMIFAFTGKAGKGLPIAGLILGITAMIISIAISATTVNAVDEAINETSTTTTTTDDSAAEKPAKKAQAGIGDNAVDADLQFTVTKIKTGVTQIGDPDFGAEADGEFTIVNMTIENVGAEPAYFDESEQYAFNAEGAKFSADGEASIYLDDSNSFFEEINPGNKVKGKIVFDMPEGVDAKTLELHGGMFTEGVTINLG